MGMWIGRNRKARVTYGFDEIALVPGSVTINPEEVDTTFSIPRKDGGQIELGIPVMASAMDGVVDVRFAIAMSKLGGLAVLNLDGIQTRYKNPDDILDRLLTEDKDHVTAFLQKVYTEPVKDELIVERIRAIKKGGAIAAVSSIPQRAEHLGPIAVEAGADVFIVQSTVSTVRHISTKYESLDLPTERVSFAKFHMLRDLVKPFCEFLAGITCYRRWILREALVAGVPWEMYALNALIATGHLPTISQHA